MPKRRPLAAALLMIAAVLPIALLGSAPADEPECPVELRCHVTPAAYAQTDPGDPHAYGNYDPADRPRDGNDIRYIVIHNTEESYDSAIARFQDPHRGVSAHYLIRSSDGRVTQLVHTSDIAYHAGNYWFNMHSIGIEHEGVLVDGARWYTEPMYQASARLVRHLAARYHIPLDREHIVGHDELPGATPNRVAAMHYDPGPYWDWAHYFDLLGAPLLGAPLLGAPLLGAPLLDVPLAYPPVPAARVSTPPVLMIAPRFTTNVEPLQNCIADSCSDLPPQGSNVAYLHTEPRTDAPLIGDPVLHPGGSPGTTHIADWSAKAVTGQSFVVAGRSGQWTAIWFGGQLAWMNHPSTRISTSRHGTLVTPRPGRVAIPVYGAAYPEVAAYPPTIPVTAIVPLQYTIPAGQVYLGVASSSGSYYYAGFDGANVPNNHTLVVGNRYLIEISFNHRRAFVDAADVLILP
jgi:hypothetical protein